MRDPESPHPRRAARATRSKTRPSRGTTHSSPAPLAALCCLCALAACEGTITELGAGSPHSGSGAGGDPTQLPQGSGADGQGGAGTSGQGGAGSSGGLVSIGGTGSDSPADIRITPRIWRLSASQFNDEVERLFGNGAPEVNVPETSSENGITNIAANAVVDLGNASLFAEGARAIGNWAASRGAAAARCTSYGTQACTDAFLGWFPESAFRRPVTAQEVSELRTLFDQLNTSYDYDYAFSGVVRAVLLSPDFLYRTELGVNGGTLTTAEIANLLAFGITDQSPDAQLLEAAESDALRDPDEREAQARRLMEHSERIWQRFFWEWLHLSTLESQGVEVGLSSNLIDQMAEEYRTFVREVVVGERGTLRDVLTAPYTWATPELASHYGATHPGSGVARIDLASDERGGLLTQGAWLVSHGKRGSDNVVRRGMNIYVHAMCNGITVPANLDVDAELEKLVGPNPTPREAVDARGSTTPCSQCHRVADPMGMVFETYTSDGQWQTRYSDGTPVDSNISVDGIGDFDRAPAFAAALVEDASFQYCFARRFTHFLLGVDLGPTDRVEWTLSAYQRFAETDTSLEELLVALVRHPAFIERVSAEETQ